MTGPVDDFDDEIPVGDEVEEGRTVTSGRWSPDWVVLNFSAPAVKIYMSLRMRLNKRRNGKRVWPGTASLAVLLDLNRGRSELPRTDSISPYLAELEKGGAINIRRERLPRRNVYVVHDTPPPGFTGPESIYEWDDIPENRLKIAAVKQANKDRNDKSRAAARAARPPKKKKQVSPDTGLNRHQEPAGQMSLLDTGSDRYQETGPDRQPDTGPDRQPDTASDRQHSYGERIETEPPPAQPPLPPHQPHQDPEEEAIDPFIDDQSHDVLARVLAEVPRKDRPSVTDQERLRQLVIAALLSGWLPGPLGERLTRGLDRADHPYGALHYRLTKGLDDPPRPPLQRSGQTPPETGPTAPPAAYRPPCGEPDCDPVTRRLVDDQGRPRAQRGGGFVDCPRCSPHTNPTGVP